MKSPSATNKSMSLIVKDQTGELHHVANRNNYKGAYGKDITLHSCFPDFMKVSPKFLKNPKKCILSNIM